MKKDPTLGPAPMPDSSAQDRLDNPIAREAPCHTSGDNSLTPYKNGGGVPKDNLGARPK